MTEFADDSLISDFVTESREHLDAIEPDLLAMEQDGKQVSQETINKVFRAIHSIKGGAGFLAFENLKSFSHTMESVLMLVRDGKLAVNPELMDVLLSAVDKLRAMIDDIQDSDNVPCAEELAGLQVFLENTGATPTKKAQASVPVADTQTQSALDLSTLHFNGEEVELAISHGMGLFFVTLHVQQDLASNGITAAMFISTVESVGEYPDSVFSEAVVQEALDSGNDSATVSFVFATVLELDLVPVGLDLPIEQIVALDKEAVRQALQLVADSPVEEVGTEEKSAEIEKTKVASPQVAETLRVRVDLLSRLMNTAGELVLGRNQLLRALEDHSNTIPGLPAILQNVDLVTSELQEAVMQTRMQPIGSVFSRFNRVIRDMARQLNKDIQLTIEGSEVELDKSIIELLSDPLTHLVRNCADHAIEMPAERIKAGKPAEGKVILRAFHEGGQVSISITDDGRGIDQNALIKKSIEKKLLDPAKVEKMSEREILNLIFLPGLSTAKVVSDVSGRGVGMDVVRTNIEQLGGHIQLESVVNEGTTVLLRLPLTLAIIPSLVVGVGEERFAVPQVNLVELVWVRAAEVAERIEQVQGADVLRLRGKLLPLVKLVDVLNIPSAFVDPNTGASSENRRQKISDRRTPTPGEEQESPSVAEVSAKSERNVEDRRKSWKGDYNILVLQVGPNQFGVIVDELFDSEEIVVKPLSVFIKDCKCFAGATIMGDGRVIMILDAGGLIDQAELTFADVEAEEKRRKEEELKRETTAAQARRSIILFNSAPDEVFAVSQSKIRRLEKINTKDIQVLGDREFIEYLGRGLPLIRLDSLYPVQPLPGDQESLYLLIPKCGDDVENVGIMVSNIIDAVDVEIDLQESVISGPGLEGAALIHDKLTLLVDPEKLVETASAVH
jgi:two-component system chemotaxis sensor kinase CheA